MGKARAPIAYHTLSSIPVGRVPNLDGLDSLDSQLRIVLRSFFLLWQLVPEGPRWNGLRGDRGDRGVARLRFVFVSF